MNDQQGEAIDQPARTSSPEPSMPLYEQANGSRRVYSTATKSRTKLPPGTPLDERRGLESLRQRMEFEETQTTENSEDVKVCCVSIAVGLWDTR